MTISFACHQFPPAILRRAVWPSRTTLRRATPSFTVEVRRRPRLATASSPNAQSFERKPPRRQCSIQSRIAPRLRHLRRRRCISRLLMLWHRILRAEFFRASSETNRYSAPRRVSAQPDPTSRLPKRPSVRPPKPRRTSRSSSAKNTPLADQFVGCILSVSRGATR